MLILFYSIIMMVCPIVYSVVVIIFSVNMGAKKLKRCAIICEWMIKETMIKYSIKCVILFATLLGISMILIKRKITVSPLIPSILYYGFQILYARFKLVKLIEKDEAIQEQEIIY